MKGINKKTLIALLAIGLLIRVGVLLLYSTIPQLQRFVDSGDSIGYTQLAQHLLTDWMFKFDVGDPTAFRMPGYPWLLVVTYVIWQSLLPIQIFQILIDLLTCLIVYQIGRYIFTNPKFALLATAAVVLHPLIIVSTISILPETLSIFLVALATLFLLNYRDSNWTGLWTSVVLCISIYMKPTLAPVSVVFLAILGLNQWSRHGLKSKTFVAALLPFVIVIVLLMPWIARNLWVMQTPILLTTSSGSNLYGGNNPQADGGYVSSEPYILPGMSEVESDLVLKRRAIEWIRSNPGDFIKLLPAKAVRFIWPLALGTSGYIAVPTPVFWLVLIASVVFYGLVLYGIWYLTSIKRYWDVIVLVTVPIVLLLLSLYAFGASRFALPAFPALAILASLGIEAGKQKIWRGID